MFLKLLALLSLPLIVAGAELPTVQGVLSDTTSLKWIDLAKTTACFIHKNASPANFTTFSGWTEVDAGTNVTIAGDSVTMNGDGTGSHNGLYWASGVTRAEGYLQLKIAVAGSVTAWFYGGFTNTAGALPNGPVANSVGLYGSTTNLNYYQNANPFGSSPISASTYYTIRIYIGKSADASTWGGLYMTIIGGTYTTETILALGDKITNTYGTTIYPFFERTTNSANLTTVKEAYWYSGFDSTYPNVTWTHYAGSGKKFDNLDLSNVALPGIVNSTNLRFSYYFGDSATGTLSDTLTLANFKNLGKITGRYAYIRIKATAALKDKTTQIYFAEPNSSAATDGIGDFPAVGDVREAATVQGAAGTLANLVATDPAYSTLESARNVGVAAGKILTGNSVKIANTTTNGTLTLPSENYVELGQANFGDPSSPKTPNLVTPAENTVKNGTAFGHTGGALTGSYVGTDTCGGGTSGDCIQRKRSFKNY